MELKETSHNVFVWSRFSDEKKLDFNGTWLITGKRSVLIDPVAMKEETIQLIKKTARPEAILLTNKDHRRASLDLQMQFDSIPIWVHGLDQPLVECPTQHTFQGGATLFGGLKVVHLPSMKSPGECAFYWDDERGTLILGDALIGKPPGGLSLLPVEKVKDPQGAKQALSELLKLRFDTLVLGDGVIFPSGGFQALKKFLEARP